MASSLSRERLEGMDQKMKLDLKGPGYYNPKLMFGQKVGQSITIPKETRKLQPPQLCTLDGQASQTSLSMQASEATLPGLKVS